ncbi:MAG: NAD(P)-dependent oxidoreductase [Gammaproteobacteria bacterium]|nr:NAD(P)-dependent oxidoreductase [Gammaproteobacteria bacterium]
MTDSIFKNPGQTAFAGHRLSAVDYQQNFADIQTPLDIHSAVVEADRCYYCYDAPCQTACPTSIDVPGFIRMIGQKNDLGAASKILTENIMGGTCARACPVETLCEHACVRQGEEGGPVQIGLLQRFATDQVNLSEAKFFTRDTPTGYRVAIIGAGPAGLSCAHRLAVLGHEVFIYEAQQKSGGLNEYGLAAYKMADDYAQREVEAILSIGGINIKNGVKVGEDISFAELQTNYDAVFMGVGLGSSNALRLDGEQAEGIISAVDYIHHLRQAEDLGELPVGQDVVVIGGGMTAIDIAIQIKRLGAANVTMAYRRGKENMSASLEEQEFALNEGVRIVHWAQPVGLQTNKGFITGVEFKATNTPDSDSYTMAADMVFKAIGQSLTPIVTGDIEFAQSHGKIAVDAERRTSHMGIWAGGDCVAGGDDLAVTAVQDGKLAALSIHNTLTQQQI